MIRKASGVWLLAALLAAATVQANPVNIVMDPGFESATPNGLSGYPVGPIGDGWAVAAGMGAICNISGAGCGNAGPAHTGSQMAFLD